MLYGCHFAHLGSKKWRRQRTLRSCKKCLLNSVEWCHGVSLRDSYTSRQRVSLSSKFQSRCRRYSPFAARARPPGRFARSSVHPLIYRPRRCLITPAAEAGVLLPTDINSAVSQLRDIRGRPTTDKHLW